MLKIPWVTPLKYLRNVVSRVPPPMKIVRDVGTYGLSWSRVLLPPPPPNYQNDLCGSWCVEANRWSPQGYCLVYYCLIDENCIKRTIFVVIQVLILIDGHVLIWLTAVYFFDWQVRVGSRGDAADGCGERPHLRAARTRRRDSEKRCAQRRQVRYVTRRRQRRVGRFILTGTHFVEPSV